MKLYLAARYDRREELLQYRDWLERGGHSVTSRWLEGNPHYPTTGFQSDYLQDASGVVAAGKFAMDDLNDVIRAQGIIAFTDGTVVGMSWRGGRHVEFGYAIGRGMSLYVVGPREHIFHCLPNVSCYQDWNDFVRRWRPWS